jgi:hypothetical protein
MIRELRREETESRALGQRLAVAPDDTACYGTVQMVNMIGVERDLGIKALP